ncbi:hypothetical protein EMIT07CA2_20041 [Brevibacillus sp. IT-7CA2]
MPILDWADAQLRQKWARKRGGLVKNRQFTIDEETKGVLRYLQTFKTFRKTTK